MNDIENELQRRLTGSVPDAPETTGWGAIARTRAARTQRVKVAAGGAGLCLAVAAALVVPGLVDASDNSAPEPPVTTSTPSGTPTDPAEPEVVGMFPAQGELPLPGGQTMVGAWEDGDLVGDTIVLGRVGAHEEIVYAAERAYLDPKTGERVESTYVAKGLRSGGRILQTVSMLSPADEEPADGIDLYDGYRLETPGSDASYRLFGSVPGDVDVTVSGDGGAPRPPTKTSTTVLPGYTVFYDTRPWDDAWDPNQAAPLTVRADGHTVAVRARTWTS